MTERTMFILASLVIVVLVAAEIVEANDWSHFKVDHQCKVVARKRGESFTVVGSDGNVGFGSTSGQTGWLCDDGVTYFR